MFYFFSWPQIYRLADIKKAAGGKINVKIERNMENYLFLSPFKKIEKGGDAMPFPKLKI